MLRINRSVRSYAKFASDDTHGHIYCETVGCFDYAVALVQKEDGTLTPVCVEHLVVRLSSEWLIVLMTGMCLAASEIDNYKAQLAKLVAQGDTHERKNAR